MPKISDLSKENFSNVKLIALDMDHTLLTDKKEFPPNFEKYVKKLASLGVKTGFASGRPLNTTKHLRKDLENDLVFVGDNGGAAAIGQEDIYLDILDKEVVQDVVDFTLNETKGALVLCGTKKGYVRRDFTKCGEFISTFFDIQWVDDYSIPAKNEDIIKISIYFQDETSKKHYHDYFKPRYGEKYHTTIGDDVWVDLTNKGVNKGKGIRKICEALNIDLKDTMAFGDTFNDIEMLETVNYSFAMLNSTKEMFEISKFVAPTNNDFGVLKVLDKVIADLENA